MGQLIALNECVTKCFRNGKKLLDLCQNQFQLAPLLFSERRMNEEIRMNLS